MTYIDNPLKLCICSFPGLQQLQSCYIQHLQVLSTAKETQLSHVMSFFIIAVLIAVKIPTAVQEVEGHLS